MIKYRLPVNVYRYRATIGGMPLREVLIFVIIGCASLFLTRIALFLPLVFVPVSLAVFYLTRRNNRFSSLLRLFSGPGNKKTGVLVARLHSLNSHLFLERGAELSLIFEVQCRDMLSMRLGTQSGIQKGIADALNNLGNRVDFFSLHDGADEVGKDPEPLAFHSYMRMSAPLERNSVEHTAEKLATDAAELGQYFRSAGFPLHEVRNGEVISAITVKATGISVGGHLSSESVVNGRVALEKTFRVFRKYVEGEDYFSNIAVVNASYTSGPYYQTFLESMKIPLDILISVKMINSRNPLQYVGRLLAERRTEYRFSRGMARETDFLGQQVADLERMKKEMEQLGSKVFDVAFTIRVHANHPALLKDRLERVAGALEMVGLRTSYDKPQATRELRNSRLNTSRTRYLMDSISLAPILPIYRIPESEDKGVVLGIDDVSERVMDYNPFSQNSYNALIIGETGSGKSYFAKIFLMRSLRSGLAERAIIFDPLDEYSQEMLPGQCKVYSVSSFIREIRREKTPGFGPAHGTEEKIKIIKPSYEEMENDELLGEMLESLNQEMSNKRRQGILIIVDECHILLRNTRNGKTLGAMVRHSRHYKASIVNISQNTDDFLQRSSSNIAYNSNRIFIFRTRNIGNSHRKVLKIDDFDIPPPENLAGGSHHPYSECVVSDGTYCRTIRIFSTNAEDRILKISV